MKVDEEMKKRHTKDVKLEITEYFFSCDEEASHRGKIRHPINVFGSRDNYGNQRKRASCSLCGSTVIRHGKQVT